MVKSENNHYSMNHVKTVTINVVNTLRLQIKRFKLFFNKNSKRLKQLVLLAKRLLLGNNYHNRSHHFITCGLIVKDYFFNKKYTECKDHHIKNHKMNKTNKQISVNKQGAKNKTALFTCDICKQSFSYKYHLINHLKTHDGGRKMKQKSYLCKICDIEYCENRVLMNHIRNTHYNFEGKVSFYRDKMVNETWVERVKHTNVCVEMTKITHNVIAIKKCSQMNIQTVESNDTIKEWIVSVDDSISGYSKVVCDYCNKKMLRKSLPSHIRERHLNIKPFNCKTCGHNFNRKYQLSKHACGKYRQKPRRN